MNNLLFFFFFFFAICKLMAVLCSSTPFTPLKKPWPIAKTVNNKVWMLQTRSRKLCVKKLQIRSSMKNKVYEDQSEGVICYTNEAGEMICEGYDEGPRYRREMVKTAAHLPRDAEMSDLLLLQRSWLQIVKGEELNHASKGGVALKGNGSNTPC